MIYPIIFCAVFMVAAASSGVTEVAPADFSDLGNLIGPVALKAGPLTTYLIMIAAAIKALVPIVLKGAVGDGAKIYMLTAIGALATAIVSATADGIIQPDEWTMLLSTLAAVIAAPFGYRAIFSQDAKNLGAVKALFSKREPDEKEQDAEESPEL